MEDTTETTDGEQAQDCKAAMHAHIRAAARRAALQAPPLVPGSPQWQRLTAILAEIPDTPDGETELLP